MKRIFTLIFTLFFSTSLFSGEGPFGVYIMRHGEAEHNLTHSYNSALVSDPEKESHLTAKGREQALETARKLIAAGLNQENVIHVFVSPLPRTIETAEVLKSSGLFSKDVIVIDPRLIEIQYGDLEGAKILPDWNESYAEKYHAEKDQEINQRVESFYNDLQRDKLSGNVIVITHGILAQKLMSLFSDKQEKLAPAGFVGPL